MTAVKTIQDHNNRLEYVVNGYSISRLGRKASNDIYACISPQGPVYLLTVEDELGCVACTCDAFNHSGREQACKHTRWLNVGLTFKPRKSAYMCVTRNCAADMVAAVAEAMADGYRVIGRQTLIVDGEIYRHAVLYNPSIITPY